MKRWKDDDKTRAPMFPRLHVNDTEKGGPRAPPRNKMALYEQLSIPSQRFTHAVPPLNPNNGSSDLVPSSSQGVGSERQVFSSRKLPPRHHYEKQYSQCSDISTETQVELRKELDEDDFRVPIFVQSIPNQECGQFTNYMNAEKLSPSNTSSFNPTLKLKKGEVMGLFECSKKLECKNQKEENSKELEVGQTKAISKLLFIEKAEDLQKKTYSSVRHKTGENPINRTERLKSPGSVQPELCGETQPASNMQSTAVLGEQISIIPKRGSCPTVRDHSYDSICIEDGSRKSVHMVNLEKGDSMSETSIVGSISRLDITPDDVVGMIGQKHFWKARRAIANQQRVFANQIFELHRLIKVQRLIATSPHLLVEETPHITKPINALPVKNLPLDHPVKALPSVHPVKALPSVPKQGNSEKPCHKEASAENPGVQTALSSVQNGAPPSDYKSLCNTAPSPPAISSNYNARPWSLNQSQGPQWLIPVMSPSEGLVYKPYPGPGLGGPTCGSFGPPVSNAVPSNLLAYSVPAPHPQYQFPSFPATSPYAYFPPYSVPIMNNGSFSCSSVEQTNQPSMPTHFPSGEANFSVHHQNVLGMPSQSKGAVPEAVNLSATEDVEVLASTASSSIERKQGSGPGNAMEGSNALRLFPTSPIPDTTDSSSQPPVPERPNRVIKVVPHNAKSATESVARIFQSIQKERKQHDSPFCFL